MKVGKAQPEAEVSCTIRVKCPTVSIINTTTSHSNARQVQRSQRISQTWSTAAKTQILSMHRSVGLKRSNTEPRLNNIIIHQAVKIISPPQTSTGSTTQPTMSSVQSGPPAITPNPPQVEVTVHVGPPSYTVQTNWTDSSQSQDNEDGFSTSITSEIQRSKQAGTTEKERKRQMAEVSISSLVLNSHLSPWWPARGGKWGGCERTPCEETTNFTWKRGEDSIIRYAEDATSWLTCNLFQQRAKEPAAPDTDIILAICPSNGCYENIPGTVSNTLRAKINKRKALIDAQGPGGRGVAQLELEICLQITKERDRESLQRRAIANQWPIAINFASLPERIERFENDINSLPLMSIEVETNYIFCNLVDDLIMLGLGKTSEEALVQFSNLLMPSMPRMVVDKARPG